MILVLIALSLPEIAQIILAIGTILTATVAIIRWLMKKYVISLERTTAATPAITHLKDKAEKIEQQSEASSKRVEEIFDIVSSFKGDLDIHMKEEIEERNKEYKKVIELQETVNAILENQSVILEGQIDHSLSIVKGLATTDDTPVLIYKTYPGGYETLWVNDAWTNWTGLDLPETRAGGDILTIKEGSQRDVLEPEVIKSGQEKKPIDVHYTMVKPKTGEEVGEVWSHAYPMLSSIKDEWYYVARMIRID